eukprot:scaffold324926_cov66-Tisochrysis_lutea.AAC.1
MWDYASIGHRHRDRSNRVSPKSMTNEGEYYAKIYSDNALNFPHSTSSPAPLRPSFLFPRFPGSGP